jgi:hypothetical protein
MSTDLQEFGDEACRFLLVQPINLPEVDGKAEVFSAPS